MTGMFALRRFRSWPRISRGIVVTTTPTNRRTMECHLQEEHPHHAGAAEALRLGTKTGGKQYDTAIVRQLTEVESQAISHEPIAEKIVESLPKDSKEVPIVDLFLPETLKDCLFVGHIVTDLDSVAGAIGAAALYGGTAALASEVNSETQFALEYWNVEKPKPIEILLNTSNSTICLVDHQQTSQMNPNISVDQIVGVIDHHALQSKTIVTDKPIYIDIRPWGSMSTIIAHTFMIHQRRPETPVAGMLLCAILSDTLNLLGPTTTEWDRLMVAVLSEICEIDDIQLLASQQFKAKSKELAETSAFGLVNGDQKTFSFDAVNFTGDIGFAVVETTDDGVILEKLDALIPEMVACKKEKSLTCIFLAVVNIVELHSNLLLCGPAERNLAEAAFGGELSNDHRTMDLGKRVSRKKDFIPTITSTIKNGWTKPTARGPSVVDLQQLGKLVVDPTDPYGNVKRVGSLLDSGGSGNVPTDKS